MDASSGLFTSPLHLPALLHPLATTKWEGQKNTNSISEPLEINAKGSSSSSREQGGGKEEAKAKL